MNAAQPLHDGEDERSPLVLTPELIATINEHLCGMWCGEVALRIQDGAFYTVKKEETFRVAHRARNRNRKR